MDHVMDAGSARCRDVGDTSRRAWRNSDEMDGRCSSPMTRRATALWLQPRAGNHAVAAVLARGRTNGQGSLAVQRKGGSGGGTATGEVGIPGGESKEVSDRPGMAAGYAQRPDGQYGTPDKRVVPEEQAADESAVINSMGVYMAAYLARYNMDSYGLTAAQLAVLSEKAVFLRQFETGDVVLRLMDASDSTALAKVTSSQYSHSGIVHRVGDRVMVLDSYPQQNSNDDASTLTGFEEIFRGSARREDRQRTRPAGEHD